jgi:hypothetical protein
LNASQFFREASRKKKWIGSEKEKKRKKLLLVPKKIKACALVFSIVFSCRE